MIPQTGKEFRAFILRRLEAGAHLRWVPNKMFRKAKRVHPDTRALFLGKRMLAQWHEVEVTEMALKSQIVCVEEETADGPVGTYRLP